MQIVVLTGFMKLAHPSRSQFHGSAYRKQSHLQKGNSMLASSVFHGLAGILTCARAYSTLLGILCLNSKCRKSMLAHKRRMVIISAEFGGKQSHDIGPSAVTARP